MNNTENQAIRDIYAIKHDLQLMLGEIDQALAWGDPEFLPEIGQARRTAQRLDQKTAEWQLAKLTEAKEV